MSILVSLSNTLGTFSWPPRALSFTFGNAGYYGAARSTAGKRTAVWAEIPGTSEAWTATQDLGLMYNLRSLHKLLGHKKTLEST